MVTGFATWWNTTQELTPTNPGSSPRPYVFSGGKFDPDGDSNSNAVVWRPHNGMWYIRDYIAPGNHMALQFGLRGDVPFVYQPQGHTSNVGVIRELRNDLLWYFNGPGLLNSNGTRSKVIRFGIFGDNLIPGPWETPGVTTPAVARLFNNHWTFFFRLSNGEIRQSIWGGNGDVPKVQDYDGDGIFDVAVFRPSEQKTYVIQSSDGLAQIYEFGSGTADHTVRGDVSGDGMDDIISWEPMTGMFSSLMSSATHHSSNIGAAHSAIEHLQLGLYFVHLPFELELSKRESPIYSSRT